MKKNKNRYYKRQFLNKNEGRALMEADIVNGEDTIPASINISDCNRTIFLDFYVSREDRSNVRDVKLKIKTFRNFINEFCDKMEELLNKKD